MKCSSCGMELPGIAGPCPACGTRRSAPETTSQGIAGATDLPTRARAARPDSQGGALLPGAVLGRRFRILSLAGRGGMGEVYRAEDLELGQTVALKILPKSLERNDDARIRLLDEVRVARQVSHPNVCRVYDIGEAEGRLFISMEWIEGRTSPRSWPRRPRCHPTADCSWRDSSAPVSSLRTSAASSTAT